MITAWVNVTTEEGELLGRFAIRSGVDFDEAGPEHDDDVLLTPADVNAGMDVATRTTIGSLVESQFPKDYFKEEAG